MKLAKVKAPNTYLLIFSIIIITAGLTWLIPSGEYDHSELNGRMVVVPNSYHTVDSNPQGIWAILKAPIRGFTDKSAALIVGFVLIVGGVFAILEKTRAIDAAIKAVAKAHSHSKLIEILYIPIFMTIFSIGGGSFGMGEVAAAAGNYFPDCRIFTPDSSIFNRVVKISCNLKSQYCFVYLSLFS